MVCFPVVVSFLYASAWFLGSSIVWPSGVQLDWRTDIRSYVLCLLDKLPVRVTVLCTSTTSVSGRRGDEQINATNLAGFFFSENTGQNEYRMYAIFFCTERNKNSEMSVLSNVGLDMALLVRSFTFDTTGLLFVGAHRIFLEGSESKFMANAFFVLVHCVSLRLSNQ